MPIIPLYTLERIGAEDVVLWPGLSLAASINMVSKPRVEQESMIGCASAAKPGLPRPALSTSPALAQADGTASSHRTPTGHGWDISSGMLPGKSAGATGFTGPKR